MKKSTIKSIKNIFDSLAKIWLFYKIRRNSVSADAGFSRLYRTCLINPEQSSSPKLSTTLIPFSGLPAYSLSHATHLKTTDVSEIRTIRWQCSTLYQINYIMYDGNTLMHRVGSGAVIYINNKFWNCIGLEKTRRLETRWSLVSIKSRLNELTSDKIDRRRMN